MEKLEKLHVKSFDIINHFSPYDITRECTRAKDNDKMAQKASEITADVAIKFTEFLKNYSYQGKSLWVTPNDETTILTTQELFEVFINNHYEKIN
jgi:hypothetical protein